MYIHLYIYIYILCAYVRVLLVGLKDFLQNWWSAQLKMLGTADLEV